MFDNRIKIEFMSKSQNEAFARVAVAAFIAQIDPTIEELNDVKTAVSEAVTNSIIHGYDNKEENKVIIEAEISGREVEISVIDFGKGICDIEKVKEPLYTSRPDLERSGMGFTVMESFMDSLEIQSKQDEGTKVVMRKKFEV